MSVRIAGSDRRMALELPAEGQGWKREGDAMIAADLGGGAEVLTFQAVGEAGSALVRFHLPAGTIGECLLTLDQDTYAGAGDGGESRALTVTHFQDDTFFDEVAHATHNATTSNIPYLASFSPNLVLADPVNTVQIKLEVVGGTAGCSFLVQMKFTPAAA